MTEKQPEKILIFELNWLGDILFSFPLLKALRWSFPEAYISCAVVPRYADLLANNPWISDIHILSDDNGLCSIGEKMAFTRLIAGEKYDTCILLKPSSSKASIAALAGIPRRIGFSGKRSNLTTEVEPPSGIVHRADQLLALGGALGIHFADGTYEYFVNEEYEEKASALLHRMARGGGRLVVFNTGGNWGPKRWPPEYFIRLAGMLLERFSDIEIVLPGAAKDLKTAQSIIAETGQMRCYTVAGRTDLGELAALFKLSSLVVSADSGPMHLASAVGTPLVALFGPTSHALTGPRGRNVASIIQSDIKCPIPCYEKECSLGHECMRSITPERVFAEAERMLAQ
ncbi:MAG: lipopolysaccharide heptosyltransferase II [Candidatus Omnitrophica bacterium]|nr:lipopolysaccharide heptosyltransferase II [Candidatus Omnitrophota bacterium]